MRTYKKRIHPYDRMASTGVSLAALLAGRKPATIPTKTEVKTPNNVSSGPILRVNPGI